MRVLISIAVLIAFTGSLVFAQAGPKQKDKRKPKRPPAEEQQVEPPQEAPPAAVKTQAKKVQPEKAMPEIVEAAESKQATTDAAQKSMVAASGHVKRAQFTSAIDKREPVDAIDSITTTAEKIYFFTEVAGLQGKTITHRWMHEGEVRSVVRIAIGGPNWRAYSFKKLLPNWTGEWKVEVLGEDGQLLDTKTLLYSPAASAE
ncbi:MAG: DUF2914 domain-containing protein [Candidatus Latescibacterota bacterium]